MSKATKDVFAEALTKGAAAPVAASAGSAPPINAEPEPDFGPDPEDDLSLKDERTWLLDTAKKMGLLVAPGTDIETLRDQVDRAMKGLPQPDTSTAPPTEGPALAAVKEKSLRQYLLPKTVNQVRCVIQNMDPGKVDLPGELVCVGNEIIGMQRKFVPFGEKTEGGYHIPNIIYQHLLTKTFTHKRTAQHPVTKLPMVIEKDMKEYQITVLPPLTREELAELRAAQAAAGNA